MVIGPSTQQLSTPGVTAIAEPVFTFDGSIHTTGPLFDFFIDGYTLSRGGVVDVDGTRISCGQGGTNIVIGTSTQDLSTASITAVEEPAITLDGSTYYANSASEFVINGRTYAATGTDVAIGTRTEAVGLGGYIMSVFGSGPSSTLPVAFTGKAGRKTPAAGVLCLIFVGLALYIAG